MPNASRYSKDVLCKRIAELDAAIDTIDCLIMDPKDIARDTKLVGGPVSNFCVDYDERAVVERVRKYVEQHHD